MSASSVQHVDERSGRALKIIDDGEGIVQPAVAQRGRRLRQKRRIARTVVEDDEALHADAFADDEGEVARAGLRFVVLRDHAALDAAPERLERRKRGLELHATDIVEVDVDAVWRSGRKLCAHVAISVRKRVVEAQRATQVFGLLDGTRASDGARAVQLCKL